MLILEREVIMAKEYCFKTPQDVINYWNEREPELNSNNIKEIQQLAREMLQDIKNNIDSKKETKKTAKKALRKRIINWKERSGINKSIEHSLDKISNDEMFASFFAKDAKKQNTQESMQIEILYYLLEEGGVLLDKYEKPEDLKLPSSGKNQLSLVNGELVKGQKSKNHKNIDLMIELPNSITVYLTLKYTGNNGGAQDNQKHNARSFLDNRGENEELFICAGVDGDYYHGPTLAAQRNLNFLKEREDERTHVGSVTQIAEQLIKWSTL